jgi:hypothetical protein
MKRFVLVSLLALVGCGKDRGSFDDSQPKTEVTQNAPGASSGGADTKEGGGGGPGYGDDIPLPSCGPHNCKTGCCSQGGACVEGTAPDQCGKGGLDCMNCKAVGYGCKDQGCNPQTTCTGCDGCCKAGECNTAGKTQDNACGGGGAVCVDCTTSGQTCDGNGHCR